MKSIRTKILLCMTTTVAACLLITGIASILLNYNSTNQLLDQTMTQTAKVAAQRVSHELKSYSNVAFDAGCNPKLSDPDLSVAEKQKVIDQFVKANGFTYGNILDEKAVSIFTGTDYSDRTYAQEALKGNTYISEPLISKMDGKLAIMIAAPLWENGVVDSEIIGLVYFKPVETFLNDIVSTLQVSDNGYAYILNSGGTTIAHKNIENVKNQENTANDAKTDSSLAKLAALESNMVSGQTGFGTYKYGGVEKFLAYSPINGTDGWSVGINAPKADFMSGTVQSAYLSGILLIVAAIAASILALWLATGISKPIALCCDRLELLADGDLTSPTPEINKKDEIGRLSSSTDIIVSSIHEIITDIGYGMSELSKGNFAVECQKPSRYKGDYSAILQSIQDLIDHMTVTLSQVRESSDQVAISSDQVSAGAQQLSQGATEQASSVQELAASVTEIASEVKSTATDASKASSDTNDAGAKLDVTTNDIKDLSSAMDEITEASSQISNVIKTIEDLAFQTNILALNAAVEAARAGAAGKGFAVVADEVRNLANKSSDASKSTAALIERSITAVKKGSHLSDVAAKSIIEVGEVTRNVVTTISQIANAAQQQSDGLAQLAIGIDQISSVVQTNSATAEESAAASEMLSGQAQTLNELVERFKIKNVSNDKDSDIA